MHYHVTKNRKIETNEIWKCTPTTTNKETTSLQWFQGIMENKGEKQQRAHNIVEEGSNKWEAKSRKYTKM